MKMHPKLCRILPILNSCGFALGAFAMAFFIAAPAAFAAVPQERIPQAIAAQAQQNQWIEALVLLDDSAEEAGLRGQSATPPDIARMAREDYEAYIQQKKELLGALKNATWNEVADADIELLTHYSVLPVLHVRVQSAQALNRLARHGKVLAIDENRETHAYLTQSLPLIQQPTAQTAGHAGAGTTVAVLDTGVDYTLSAFGSCSAPGEPCKVVHTQDFAPEDGLLDADGHGTNVAGIVAGVAPGTRIAALDVFDGSGAWSSDIINAINWCISNKATHNIAAINMSLGGGAYTAAVAPVDAWSTSITNAISAGILVVAASGNDAYINALGLPAAYSNVVSVGAVYDSNVGGGLDWTACYDSTTAANQVTCFSNSASFLTMLAPGAFSTAAGYTMGGTSQAAPHVAGAAAVLRAAYPADSVIQLTNRLKLGTNVLDFRNGITKPRLNLVSALQSGLPNMPTIYALSAVKTGTGTGTIVSTPNGIYCGATCAANYAFGRQITLTAQPAPGATFAGWSGACSGTATSCTVSMTSAKSVTAAFMGSTENFPPGGAMPGGWVQGAGSSAPWFAASDSAYVGSYSLKSGDVADWQMSVLSYTADFGAGTLSFARRVSSEGSWDFLNFYIDDVLKGSWSGEVPWGIVTFPITAGSYELRWEYSKDGSLSTGSDAAWIDAVSYPAASTCTTTDANVLLSEATLASAYSVTACDTITIGPKYQITETGHLDAAAGTRITLTPGFRINPGGRLSARIQAP